MPVGTNRLEAFSDAVLAIAITLLVLDLEVPEDAGGGLGAALLEQWPSYAAYVTSFVTIGIMWVNHHVIVGSMRRVDRVTLFLNLALLLAIATLPFTTSLAASYLRAEAGASLAMAVYAAWMAVIAGMFVLMLVYLGRHRSLLRPHVTAAQNRGATQRGMVGVAVYLVAALIAVASPIACLGLCLAMPLYYIVAGIRIAHDAFDADPGRLGPSDGIDPGGAPMR